MMPVCAPMLKEPPPWHLCFCLLNKWYLHCIQNCWHEAYPNIFSCFLHVPFKVLHYINNILMRALFFLCFIFISQFSWACGNLHQSRKLLSNSLFVHSILCQTTHSFLNGIAKLVSALPDMYVLSIILISAWSKYWNVFEKGYYTADNGCYNLDNLRPSNDLHKLSDTRHAPIMPA